MHPARSVVLITGACNLVAMVHGLVYGRLAVWPDASPLEKELLYGWIAIVLIIVFCVGSPIFFHAFSIINKIYKEITRGIQPRTEELAAARRDALNLPLSHTRIVTSIWIVSALSFIPLYFIVLPKGDIFLALHVAVITILAGSVSVSFLFYSLEWYSRKYLIPVLLPNGNLSQVKGVIAVSTQYKIMELVLTTSALPVAVLCIAAFIGTVTSGVIIYLGITFLIFGLAQGIIISRSLSRPLKDVVCEMNKVRNGDYGARASVVSLGNMGELTEGFNNMVQGLQKAEFVRESFGRYVSREVVDRVIEGNDVEGSEKEATVLFCDIRNFTATSEKLRPEKLLTLLNTYLDVMVEAVVENGGRVDKFIGDSVMAVFGAPEIQEDHARNAVRTGLLMLEKLQEWNSRQVINESSPWEIGIALHSGSVIAGNIGSARKMEYAVIGDVVNTAARIEGLNKALGTSFLISKETYEFVKNEVLANRYEGVNVKGKKEPITVYEVFGLREKQETRCEA